MILESHRVGGSKEKAGALSKIRQDWNYLESDTASKKREMQQPQHRL